jgi:hypothetical protein
MRVQKSIHMACRLQLRIFRMTKRAAIRQIDLVVAHQAIRHLRHVGRAHRIRILQPPMARHTRIRRIQQRPDLRAIAPQIRALIDGRGNRRCNVAELQMLGVAEFLERRWRRGRESPESRSQKEYYRTATVREPVPFGFFHSSPISPYTESAKSSSRHRRKPECSRPATA